MKQPRPSIEHGRNALHYDSIRGYFSLFSFFQMIMDEGFYETMSKVSWGFRYTLLSDLPPFFPSFWAKLQVIDSLEVL